MGLLDSLMSDIDKTEAPLPVEWEEGRDISTITPEEIAKIKAELGPNGQAAFDSYLKGEKPDAAGGPIEVSRFPSGNPLSPSGAAVQPVVKGVKTTAVDMKNRDKALVRAAGMAGGGGVVAAAASALDNPSPEALSRSQPVVNLAQAIPDLKKRNLGVIGAADAAIDTFARTSEQLKTAADEKVARAGKVRDELSGINEVVAQDIKYLTPSIADDYAKISNVDRRLEEIAQMSPARAKLKALFDPNYNVDRLNQIKEAATNNLKRSQSQFQTTAMLQDRMYQIVSQRFEGEEQYARAISETFALDNSIAKDHLGLQIQAFNSVAQGIQANSAALQAMDAAEDSELTGLTPVKINAYLAQASKSKDGTALVNGIPIPVDKLRTRALQIEQQDLAIKNSRLALQSQNLALQQQQNNVLVGRMSLGDIRSAVANGGVFRGVKLDMRVLQDAYQSGLQLEQTSIVDRNNQLVGSNWGDAVSSLHGEINQRYGAVRAIVGSGATPEIQRQMYANANKLKQLGEQIKNAPADQRKSVAAFAISELSKLRDENNATLDKLTKTMTSDPAGQATLRSWIDGTPQTPGDAMAGIISLTRAGSLPPGVPGGSEAGKLLGRAAKIQSDVKAQNPKANPTQLNRMIANKIESEIGGAWAQQVGASLINQVISSASADGHPAGLIGDETWRKALKYGDQSAYLAAAQTYGITEREAISLFGQPNDSAEAKAFEAKTKVTMTEFRQQLSEVTTTNTLRYLDQNAPAGLPDRPSKLLSNYMNSAGYQNKTMMINRAMGSSDVGAFLVSGVAGSKIPSAMAARAMDFQNKSDQLDLDYYQARANQGYDKSQRGQVGSIVSRLNTLEVSDKRVLESYLQSIPNPGAARSVILGPKLKDPNLARIQSIAAKEWDAASKALSMEDFVRYTTINTSLNGM